MYAQRFQRRRKRLTSNRKGTINRRHGWGGLVFVGLAVILLLLMLSLVYFIFRVVRGFWKPSSHATERSEMESQKDTAQFRLEADRRFSDTLNKTLPLDDFLTRKHISLSSREGRDEDLPLLVVGGSDGSGTRVFVDILGRLGVPMVIDDTGTLDVHASCMFDGDGWPALVRTILKTTQRANYSWEDFSLVQQSMLQSTLDRFLELYGKRGRDLRAEGVEEGFPVAQKVLFGFKAPVSMLTLPLFRHVYGRIKFLHIVRDGRDVSLSKNKSPVQKFYHVFYEDSRKRQNEFQSVEGDIIFQEAMSIQLWNDWNAQVLDWEQKHSDGETFDYLVMRTEDLMDPRTRLTSLRQLADFVGSQKTDSDLCCLSKQKIHDMGKSGVRPADLVMAPPGKWLSPMGYFLQYLVHAVRLIFGMDFESSKRQEHVDGGEEHVHRGHRADSSVERMTDGEDLPFQEVLQGIEMERQAVSYGLRQQRPDLFRQIDQARQRRFKTMNDLKFGDNLAGSVLNVLKNQEQPHDGADHRRLYEYEEDNGSQTGGGADRIPWGNTTIPPKVKVDHVKYDTMMERLKQLEVARQREKLMQRPGIAAELARRRAEFFDQEESPEKVMERYGKWRNVVEDRPELNKVLHNEASEGLRLFGYEPKTRFSDFPVAGECIPLSTCKSPPVPK